MVRSSITHRRSNALALELLKNDDASARARAPEHAQIISRQFDSLFQFYIKYTDIEMENKAQKLIHDAEHTLLHIKDAHDGAKLADEVRHGINSTSILITI